MKNLIVDLTSSNIGLSVVNFDKKKLPKLDYFERYWYFESEKKDSVNFAQKMLGELSAGLNRIQKRQDLISKIDSVNIFLSSPWFFPFLNIIKLESPKTIIFNNKIYNSIFSKIKIPEKFKNSELVEKIITDIDLNGYNTNNPFNKKFRKINASVYLSFASKETLDKIKKEISSQFKFKKIFFHTHPLSISHSLKNFLGLENGLFIDTTGETSEVGIMSSGGLISLISLPIGENEVLRRYMKERVCEKAIAISELNTILSNKSDPEKMKGLENLINDFSKVFVDQIHQAIGEKTILSNNIFLMSHGFGQKLLFKIINSEYANQTLFDGQICRINFLQDNFIEPIIECQPFDLPRILEDSFMQHAINYLNFNLFKVE